MKKILNGVAVGIFLGMLMGSLVAYWQQPQIAHAQTSYTNCDQSRTVIVASGSTSGTSATQIVAAISGDPIYVCGVLVVGTSGTTPTFGLVAGTGSNCASNQKTIVPAISTAANTPIYLGGRLLNTTPAGYALCYLDTGTSPVQFYVVSYAQG